MRCTKVLVYLLKNGKDLIKAGMIYFYQIKSCLFLFSLCCYFFSKWTRTLVKNISTRILQFKFKFFCLGILISMLFIENDIQSLFFIISSLKSNLKSREAASKGLSWFYSNIRNWAFLVYFRLDCVWFRLWPIGIYWCNDENMKE